MDDLGVPPWLRKPPEVNFLGTLSQVKCTTSTEVIRSAPKKLGKKRRGGLQFGQDANPKFWDTFW